MSARSTTPALVEGFNLAVVTGRVAAFVVRELPDGSTVTQFDVAHLDDGRKRSVPVAAPGDVAAAIEPGDDALVVGRVERRFFRAAGATQSRTELVAARAVPLRRRRTAQQALADSIQQLGGLV